MPSLSEETGGRVSMLMPGSTIGIIGGADGPTAIFISGRANPQAVSNVFSRLAGVVKVRWNRLWA